MNAYLLEQSPLCVLGFFSLSPVCQEEKLLLGRGDNVAAEVLSARKQTKGRMKVSTEVSDADTKVITHERQVPDMLSVQASQV